MAGPQVSDRPLDEIIVRPGASPLTARVRVLDAGFSKSKAQDIVKIVLRVLLGGLFAYGGYLKLDSPFGLAFAIKGFKLGLPDHLVIDLAFMIPWLELLAGVSLIVGFFTRGAGLVIVGLMAFFIAGIGSVIWRGIDTHCGCFGKLDFICPHVLGACHIIRNVVLGAIAGYLAKVGAGPYSLDRIRARQHIPGYKLV
jgi:uncharacterized membrane protein YphA (DoxX/SURF4 family)